MPKKSNILDKLFEGAPAAPPKETRGVRIARQNRKICNDLDDADREAVTEKAMRVVYGKRARVGSA